MTLYPKHNGEGQSERECFLFYQNNLRNIFSNMLLLGVFLELKENENAFKNNVYSSVDVTHSVVNKA